MDYASSRFRSAALRNAFERDAGLRSDHSLLSRPLAMRLTAQTLIARLALATRQAIACQYGSRSTITLSGDTQFCDDNWCPGKVAIITMRAPQLCSRAEGSPSVNTASGSVAHFSVGKTQKGAGPLVVSNGARGKAAGLLQPTIRSLAHSAT